MKKTIDEILASYTFFLDVEIQIQGIYKGKKIITGIPDPDGLKHWFTLRDCYFPQHIYVSGLEIPAELKNNAILDITGILRRPEHGLFYIEASDLV